MPTFIKTGLWENSTTAQVPKGWLNLTKLIKDKSGVASQITTALAGYATQSFVNTGLATKQDKLQDTTGNIGVGKIDTSATEKLDVNGNVKANSFIKSGGTSTQFLMADGSVSTLTNPVTGTGTVNYIPKFTSSGIIGNSLIYDNGTNVGIGTTSPSYKLDVNGMIFSSGGGFSSPASENGFRLKMYDNGGTNNDPGIGLDGSGGGSEVMWFNSLGGFYFNNGTAGEKIRITPEGNVGIATTSPSEKLEVNGNVKATGFKTSTGTPNQALTADGSVFDLNTKADLTLVNNLQIGGRNLFGFNKGINFLINTIDKSINGYICNYTSDNLIGRIMNLGLEGIGGDFVVSLYIKANKNVVAYVNLCDVSTSNTEVSVTTDFVKHIFYFKNVYQYTGPDMFGFLDIECTDSTAKVFVKDLKIEKGNKATDWTPAPEDIQTALDNKQKKVTVITITGDTTLSEAHNGAILHITNSCTLTFAADLGKDFNFVEKAFGSIVVQHVAASGVTLNSDSRLILKNDAMGSVYAPSNNNFILTGTYTTS